MSSETPPKTPFDVTGWSIEQFSSDVRAPLVGIAFWSAIALPFLHLPLLFVTGLSTSTEAGAFVALLVLNVVSVFLGHSYHGQ
ncbi:hypothetical protein VB773_14450 [Haloarculaceae archaeon H-GB2-1]|nr:hypothetical protein [Haloarculaceae archaeon H-GB1-1]MEA5387158.1 hypothetical protein [Haloarculaceae archaeon H-GB11]MEA5408651.1 hypothetical protein [Haloarculaceae archaeon H-GB2-1]